MQPRRSRERRMQSGQHCAAHAAAQPVTLWVHLAHGRWDAGRGASGRLHTGSRARRCERWGHRSAGKWLPHRLPCLHPLPTPTWEQRRIDAGVEPVQAVPPHRPDHEAVHSCGVGAGLRQRVARGGRQLLCTLLTAQGLAGRAQPGGAWDRGSARAAQRVEATFMSNLWDHPVLQHPPIQHIHGWGVLSTVPQRVGAHLLQPFHSGSDAGAAGAQWRWRQ